MLIVEHWYFPMLIPTQNKNTVSEMKKKPCVSMRFYRYHADSKALHLCSCFSACYLTNHDAGTECSL